METSYKISLTWPSKLSLINVHFFTCRDSDTENQPAPGGRLLNRYSYIRNNMNHRLTSIENTETSHMNGVTDGEPEMMAVHAGWYPKVTLMIYNGFHFLYMKNWLIES